MVIAWLFQQEGNYPGKMSADCCVGHTCLGILVLLSTTISYTSGMMLYVICYVQAKNETLLFTFDVILLCIYVCSVVYLNKPEGVSLSCPDIYCV